MKNLNLEAKKNSRSDWMRLDNCSNTHKACYDTCSNYSFINRSHKCHPILNTESPFLTFERLH